MSEDVCRWCGSRVRPGVDEWCTLCLHRLDELPPPPADVAPALSRPYAEPAAPTLKVYSRRRADAMSYGLTGRIVWTACTLLLPLPMVIVGARALIGLGFAALWYFVVTPMILRDVWRKARVH